MKDSALETKETSMEQIKILNPLRILLTAGAIASLAAIAAYIAFAQAGIDLTDEGYYLNWLENFNEYPAIATLFAFVYEPLYWLADKNLTILRVLNILLILSVGILMQLRAIHWPNSTLEKGRETRVLVFTALVVSSTSLLALGSWTTPSYNHLTYIGCTLICCSLIPYADIKTESRYILNGLETIFLSGGVALTFLGKPSSGLALTLIIIIFGATRNRLAKSKIFISIVCSVIISGALASWGAGGSGALINKIMLGKEWLQILDGGYSLTRLTGSVIKIALFPLLLTIPVFIGLQIKLVSTWESIDRPSKRTNLIAATLLLGLILMLAALAFLLSTNSLIRLNLFTLSLVFTTAIMLNHGGNWRKLVAHLRGNGIIQYYGILAIALIPFCYGFGTNTNLWIKALSASSIYTALTLKIMSSSASSANEKYRNGIIACCLLSLFISLPGIAAPIIHPYRQEGAKWTHRSQLTIVPNKHKIYVSKNIQIYVTQAQKLLNNNGFKSGTPIIDMTGQSPSLIYLLGGKAVGQAWMIGGYPGSNALAKKAISKITKRDLNHAWIITEKQGQRSLDLTALTDNGLDIYNKNQYIYVGSIVTPKGAGGNEERRVQSFYRPKY
jgi:hypothetical protein